MVPAVPSPSTAAQTSVLVARQLATAPGAPEVADATTVAVGSRIAPQTRAAPTASRRQLRSFSFMVGSSFVVLPRRIANRSSIGRHREQGPFTDERSEERRV